ncbi:helix-turn-helix domain-containing protein [Clostridiales Family XIII bacterium WCA-MUC-591-APC-3H]|uniref:Helix-turn-helix domain-containing protein n=1 Tax=Hornefia butyriciproducens TaxID=2652293 RepID=A0A6L5Y876_9FIRM|nr:helix-turn-helix domain-containing protein [Hornefia butyriciproducens]
MTEVKIRDTRETRIQLGDTQSEFAERYRIPFRTVQNWESGVRKPLEYVLKMLSARIRGDLINRKSARLPKYDSLKKNLPDRRDYRGAAAWLKAVRDVLGNSVVFALDEALMCQGSFGGRSGEYIVWVYGDDSLAGYNGVVVLGNYISPYCVEERNGLRFTDFNRTIADSFANEKILDMQGITEAVSKYYFTNNGSFDGVSIAPEYQSRFEELADEAVNYYDN